MKTKINLFFSITVLILFSLMMSYNSNSNNINSDVHANDLTLNIEASSNQKLNKLSANGLVISGDNG